MNIKRIKCILLGGCQFKSSDRQVNIDENDIVTITEVCCKCGKIHSFSIPYIAFCDQFYKDNYLSDTN